ncbi:MAG: AAA family ATPase [Sandaracinus sp.]
MSGTVELQIAVVIEGMGDGRVRAAPLFERAWMTHDDEVDAIESLRTFVETRLAEASPREVARIASHAAETEHAVRMIAARTRISDHDPEPLWIDVAAVILGADARSLERALAPGRAARQLAGATAPPPATTPTWLGQRELWVAIPAIDHVMRIPDEIDSLDGLDRAIGEEVERLLAASARDALDVLAAMPAAWTRVRPITLQVRRPERLDAETRAKGQRASAEALRLEEKRRLLARAGRRVEHRARPARRDELVAQLEALLGSEERLAVLVRGPELAGKSSLVEHVLGKLGRPAFAVPLARFLAGSGGFGEWQTQVEETFRAAEVLDAVLYVEDLGGLALERAGSPIDLASAFAPFLEARKVRFVGEIRDSELDAFEARHRGLASTLLPVRVPPLDAAETVRVLEETLGPSAAPVATAPTATPKRTLESDAIRSLVALVERYQPYRALPGEALRTAHALRDALEVPRREDGSVPAIGRAEIVRAIAERLGLPAALLREDVALPPDEIAQAIRRRVIGQDEAVEAVAATLGVVKAGLSAPHKPIATFLFAGPTGTGKTELAKALAGYLFGSAEALARFDMSEFMDPWASDRLIRGVDREDGLLTRRARERPFSVLLLDEIEKAHPSVFDLLLQVLGEGRLTDARGKTAYFQNTIVVMTSNLGARDDRPGLGFDPEPRARGETYVRAVREHFRPELLNRIDRIVPFRSLADDEALQIARLFQSAVTRRPGLADPRHSLTMDDTTLTSIARAAISRDGGARALRREIEDRVVVGAARLLARLGPDVERASLTAAIAEPEDRSTGVRVVQRGLVFDVRGQRGRQRAHLRTALDRVTSSRRRLHRWGQMASVQACKTERTRLVSELARAGQRRATPQELAALEQRLGWIAPRLDRVEALSRELEDAEDLGLATYVAEEDVTPVAVEAERIASALELALYEVVASWISSDEHELTVTAIGGKRQGLDLFLVPLLGPTEGLQLSVRTHFPAGFGAAVADWPSTRAWGPSRTHDEARAILRSSTRFHDVYLSLEGRDAYLSLGHFMGLVRITHEAQRFGVIVAEASDGPALNETKLPVLTAVPTTPTLEIDLDAGRAWIPGDGELYTFEGRRWTTALPRLALAAQARSEGL